MPREIHMKFYLKQILEQREYILHGLGGCVFHWEDQAIGCQSYKPHSLVSLFLPYIGIYIKLNQQDIDKYWHPMRKNTSKETDELHLLPVLKYSGGVNAKFVL
jgi:hypothetical protein